MQRKKILSIGLKLVVGIGSLLIIYIRLKNDLTPGRLALLGESAFSARGVFLFALCLLGIGLNWGIESYKWQLITAPIQAVSLKTAMKSVYSGICLGNLAPGRATEFIAKIIFFEPEYRPRITVLHFINSMFQFSITIITGLLALGFKLQSFGGEYAWIVYATTGCGVLVLLVLTICLYNIDRIMAFITKKVSRQNQVTAFRYPFTAKKIMQLGGLSLLRYSVFFTQLNLLIYLFQPAAFSSAVCIGVALYFLITSTIPMISVLEAAIRAAIALVVFKGSGISSMVLALSTVLLWFFNIVIPSGIGYYFLVKEKFNFKLSVRK